MSEIAPLMRPLRADSLLRRPAPVASCPPVQARPAIAPAPSAPPVLMRPAAFAQRVFREEHMEQAPTRFADDDDDLLAEDAMPTSQMPVPVCVPLYDPAPQPGPRRWPWALLAAALLLALAGGCLYVLYL